MAPENPTDDDIEIYEIRDEKTGEPLDNLPPGVVAVAPEDPEDQIIAIRQVGPPEEPWSEANVITAEEVFPDPSDENRVEIPLGPAEYAVVYELIPHAESLATKSQRDEAVREYVDLVRNHNVPPPIAANRVGRKISQAAFAKKAISRLLEDYHLTADIDRQLVRAGRRQIAIQALNDGDRKNALAALKAIASDPLVGLEAPPITVNTLDVTGLESLLAAVDKAKLLDMPKELQDTGRDVTISEE